LRSTRRIGGTNGTLLLDDASLFTGAVAGFRRLDRIDLAQIGFGAETTLGYAANAPGRAARCAGATACTRPP
jgi:hypothetical protein